MIGKITKITNYKSNKGAFLTINGKDYAYYGKIDFGCEEVEYTEGNPLKDGKATLKTLKPTTIESSPLRDEDKPFKEKIDDVVGNREAREAYWKDKERRDREREPIITRLSCLSSAVEHCKENKEDVIETAKRFEKYAIRGD